MSDETFENKDKILSPENLKKEKLLDVMKNVPKHSIDISDVVETINVGSFWGNRYTELQKKPIMFTYHLTKEERMKYEQVGFARLPNLATYLKKKFGGLDKFDLIFFKDFKNEKEPIIIQETSETTNVFINILVFQKYQKTIQPLINKLRVTKYANSVSKEYHQKIPKAFFNNKSPDSLVTDLQKSDYKLLEKWISAFDKMDENEKLSLSKAVEHSSVGNYLLKKYKIMKPEEPKIISKKFLNVIPELDSEDFKEVIKMLRTKKGKLFFNFLRTLPQSDTNKIVTKIPEMIRMHDHYEKLKVSLKDFKKMIQRHVASKTKDEKEIHLFLNKNPWLLGIEYFDSKKILSDFDSSGKITGDTKISRRRHADFLVQRLGGYDKCVTIELEEANEKIFNSNGEISSEVYDGINQVISYVILQRSQGQFARGLAIIGYFELEKLSKQEESQWKYLVEEHRSVDVMSYGDIIRKAENALEFWEANKDIMLQ